MIPAETFFRLIKQGEIEQVKACLDEDASLSNSQDEEGNSAVLLAAYYQQPAIARLLAKYGASLSIFEASAIGAIDEVRKWIEQDRSLVDAFAPDGFHPLGLASFFGYPEVVDVLLAEGAQVNLPANNLTRVTPLHSAVAGRNERVVHSLLENNADANAIQAGGFTPLHAAAQNGDLAIIRMLLAANADVNARDAEGKTALAFATAEDHQEAVELLQSRGGTL
jgi:ankyrin repeat protein